MRLPKFVVIMLFLTIVSLVYIHLQVQIVDFAYRGKQREMQLQTLRDNHDAIAYQICRLKSANHLGVTLLAEDSKMHFVDARNVVTLAAHAQGDEYFASSGQAPKRQNVFGRIFSLRTQAEAGSIR